MESAPLCVQCVLCAVLLIYATTTTSSSPPPVCMRLSSFAGSVLTLPHRPLVLRGGSSDARVGGDTGGGEGGAKKKHWLRSGSPPPRHTFPLSGPKMEAILKACEFDLDNEDEAKMDALVREIDQDLPSDEEEDPEQDAHLTRLRERAELLQDNVAAIYNYARAQHLSGEHLAAVQLYKKALACSRVTNSSTPQSKLCVAAVCNNLGVLYHTNANLLNYSGAGEMYERALVLHPLSADALCNLAVLHQGLGQRASSRQTLKIDNERAHQLLTRALEVNSSHVASITHLGYLMEQHLGMFDEAERLYRKALALDPTNHIILCNLAGFLCNVREPYDEETMMPVYFNKTCNTEGSYDPDTGLAIKDFYPEIDRPVDRARELYHTALQHIPPNMMPLSHGLVTNKDTHKDDDADTEPDKECKRLASLAPLAHGQFLAGIAEEIDDWVAGEEVDARIAALQHDIELLRALT